jgi:hypothetical protein
MSVWMDLPSGRRVEQPGYDPKVQGTIGPLRRADEARLRLARRNLREIEEKDVEGEGLLLVDRSTGEELEVVTSFVDLADPKLTGTTCFVVRDGWLVPMRPRAWTQEPESQYAGTIGGREATAKDPMPMPTSRSSDGA